MAIDITKIQPHEVTQDLSGKSYLIYGRPKVGKTTIASQFPKSLLIAFEKGYNLIDGVMAAPVNTWGEALQVQKQLLNLAARARQAGEEPMYKTIVIDTADLAWDMCGRWVAQQADQTYVDDIGYGRGTKHQKILFTEFLHEIMKADYTLLLIAHDVTDTVEKNGQKYTVIRPALNKHAAEVITGMVDLVAYATVEPNADGAPESVLIMRSDGEIEAGSRNPHMSVKIPFSYDALLKDMRNAIAKIGTSKGKEVKETVADNPYMEQSDDISFKDVMKQIREMYNTLQAGGHKEEYQEVVERHLGPNKLVKECTKAQIDILKVIHSELKDLVEQLTAAA